MPDILSLSSPSNCEAIKFEWPLNTAQTRKDGLNEIIEILRFVSDEYPVIKVHFHLEDLLYKRNCNEYENLKLICDKYNETIQMMKEKELLNEKLFKKKASTGLLRYIMTQSYNKGVQEPEKLNHYEPFSPQVYGETSFDLIMEILKRVKLGENDIFADLGSGVGNVVMQVAASVNCRLCYGIEKADCPAEYAVALQREFEKLMKWFGRPYGKFVIVKGDFLTDELATDSFYKFDEMTVTQVINEAKLIFVNNYAFGAEVDHQLKIKFSNMSEGAFIVSSKAFCPLNFRITSRNLNDIGAILNLNDFTPINGHVSWTDRPINYYFHRIDRTLLEKYFERLKNPKLKDENSNSADSGEKIAKSAKILKNSKRVSSSSYSGSCSENANQLENQEALSPLLNAQLTNPNEKIFNSDMSAKCDESNDKKDKIKKSKKAKSVVKQVKMKSENTEIFNASKVNLIQKSLGDKVKAKPSKKPKDAKRLSETLNLMHNEIVRVSYETGDDAASKDVTMIAHSNQYNFKAMSKMTSTNLDNRHLKEADIMDIDEINLRENLGPLVCNAVDKYMKSLNIQILNYLYKMKSPEYKEMLKAQIEREIQIQNEIKKKTNQIECHINSLVKRNVSLLKLRVSELGFNDIKTPNELIQLARSILGDHKELLNKVNLLQQAVDSLEMNVNSNREASAFSLTISTTSTIETNETQQASLNNLASFASNEQTSYLSNCQNTNKAIVKLILDDAEQMHLNKSKEKKKETQRSCDEKENYKIMNCDKLAKSDISLRSENLKECALRKDITDDKNNNFDEEHANEDNRKFMTGYDNDNDDAESGEIISKKSDRSDHSVSSEETLTASERAEIDVDPEKMDMSEIDAIDLKHFRTEVLLEKPNNKSKIKTGLRENDEIENDFRIASNETEKAMDESPAMSPRERSHKKDKIKKEKKKEKSKERKKKKAFQDKTKKPRKKKKLENYERELIKKSTEIKESTPAYFCNLSKASESLRNFKIPKNKLTNTQNADSKSKFMENDFKNKNRSKIGDEKINNKVKDDIKGPRTPPGTPPPPKSDWVSSSSSSVCSSASTCSNSESDYEKKHKRKKSKKLSKKSKNRERCSSSSSCSNVSVKSSASYESCNESNDSQHKSSRKSRKSECNNEADSVEHNSNSQPNDDWYEFEESVSKTVENSNDDPTSKQRHMKFSLTSTPAQNSNQQSYYHPKKSHFRKYITDSVSKEHLSSVNSNSSGNYDFYKNSNNLTVNQSAFNKISPNAYNQFNFQGPHKYRLQNLNLKASPYSQTHNSIRWSNSNSSQIYNYQANNGQSYYNRANNSYQNSDVVRLGTYNDNHNSSIQNSYACNSFNNQNFSTYQNNSTGNKSINFNSSYPNNLQYQNSSNMSSSKYTNKYNNYN